MKLTGRDGRAVTIPDGGHGLQGRDEGMVRIAPGKIGVEEETRRMKAK